MGLLHSIDRDVFTLVPVDGNYLFIDVLITVLPLLMPKFEGRGTVER